MKKIIFFFLLSQFTFSQNLEIEKLLIDADKSFNDNDFEAAKAKYSQITVLDSVNKKAWFNLGASELNLGENEFGCEHIYKSYSLNNKGASAVLKEYCVDKNIGSIISIKNVDEKPKFVIGNKQEYLFDENDINQKYIKILENELSKSKIISTKGKGKVYIHFTINSKGKLITEINRANTALQNKDEVITEIARIMQNMVQYIPAMYKSKAINIWEMKSFPLNFGE